MGPKKSDLSNPCSLAIKCPSLMHTTEVYNSTLDAHMYETKCSGKVA